MLKAAGACIVAKDTKRILLQQRSLDSSYPRTWGFWGGKVEPKENVSQGMLREVGEEVGVDILEYIHKIYPYDQYHSRDSEFSYYTFVVIVENEFIPNINEETGGYAWVNVNYLPKPLHPGAKRTIFKKNKLADLKDIISNL
jgi:8-oxo-dGTP pyrophosphatase MutT (NUDIX family)